MFTVKNWHRFATLTAFVCALALTGCGKKDDAPKVEADPKPGQPGPNPTPPTPPAPVDLTKTKPEATYTAKEYLKMSSDGSGGLINKHPGKVVEVTGVVAGYGPGTLALVTGDEIFKTAAFALTDTRLWLKVLPTQTVKLRSAVPTSNFDATPWVWQIIEVVGNPPITLTAEQFVKEWNADPKAFKKKFEDAVVVTGTVAEVKVTDGGGTELYLAAGKDAKLLCTFPVPTAATAPLTESQKTALKPGLKVKLLGDFTGDRVMDCIMLEPAP